MPAQPVARDIEERAPGIGDLDHSRPVQPCGRDRAQDPGGPSLHGLGNEGMPILLLALEGDEQTPGLHLSRVDVEVREGHRIRPADQFSRGRFEHVSQWNRHDLIITARYSTG